MKKTVSLMAAALLAACADVTPTALTPEFTKLDASAYDLVDLGAPGVYNQAFGLDDNGDVYGRYNVTGSGPNSSFRWTKKDGFEDLGGIDGQPFQFLRTNKHGVLTGWVPTASPNVIRPVVFLPHSGFQYVDDALHGGQAWGVNKYGVVVGSRNPVSGGFSEPFIWAEDDGLAVIPISFPAGQPRGANANAITDGGAVLGTLQVFTGPPNLLQAYAFIWDAQNGTQVLPKLSVGNVGATDLNGDYVAVGAAETRAARPGERRVTPLSFTPGDVPVHAWRWSAARGLEDLGTLGGKHSVAWAVDADGNAYGWAMNTAGVQRAVKWTVDGQIIELPSLGGPTQTGDVNKHGEIVAQSATTTGSLHAVVFVPNK